jgi:hypothetical protein
MSKIDYPIAALVGFFAGIFAIPTAYNLGIRNPGMLLALPWITTALWLAGIAIGGIISRRIIFLAQFVRFIAVGLLIPRLTSEFSIF